MLVPKKVSELIGVDYTVVNGDDLFYFVTANTGDYTSYSITFADIFLATNVLGTAIFCNNTITISNNYIDIVGDIDLDGDLDISEDMTINQSLSTNTLTANTITTQTLTINSSINVCNSFFYSNSSNTNLANTLFLSNQTLRIANSTSIDCGINRVKNVSDPVENLDALNLLYFNEHVFNCTGALVTFPTNNEPRGWLASNGQTVSRSTYQDLWQFANSSGYLASSEATKTNVEFGPGNGSTTFSLPNISCCSATATSNSSFDYINIMLVIDVSGSMEGEKLTNAKTAAKNLIQEYENNVSDVRAIVVEFSTDTANSAWIDQSNANTYIDSMPTIAMSGTYYDQSLIKAMDVFVTSGKLSGNIKNVCYFLSDGNPEPSSSIPTDTEIQTWLDFLIDNEIDTYAIGIGSGISLTYLNPIAYDGINNSDRDGEIVTNPENLSDSLISTVNYEYSYSYSIPSYIKT